MEYKINNRSLRNLRCYWYFILAYCLLGYQTYAQTTIGANRGKFDTIKTLTGDNPVIMKISDKGGQVLNVRAFGATGNGTTNDVVAIQRAIDSLPTTGGTVYFPVGTYSISTRLLLPAKIVQLVGDGWSSVLKWAGGTGNIIYDTSTTNLKISGLKFIKAAGTATGLRLENTTADPNRILIENCLFAGLDTGITGGAILNYGPYDSEIRNCLFGSDTLGLDIYGSQMILTNNKFQSCKNGMRVNPGIASDAQGGVQAFGCTWAASTQYDIILHTHPGVSGIRPCSFCGCWWEASGNGIISIPESNSPIGLLYFSGCTFNTYSTTSGSMLNFANMSGRILIEGSRRVQVNASHDTLLTTGQYSKAEVINCISVTNTYTIDWSTLRSYFTSTGKPEFQIISPSGYSNFYVDSAGHSQMLGNLTIGQNTASNLFRLDIRQDVSGGNIGERIYNYYDVPDTRSSIRLQTGGGWYGGMATDNQGGNSSLRFDFRKVGKYKFDSTYVQYDSTGIPATPPYGTGNLLIRGQAGIFYQRPDGSVHNLDSAGGGGSASAPLILTGTADTTQLLIKGYSTQTKSLFAIQDTGSHLLMDVKKVIGTYSGNPCLSTLFELGSMYNGTWQTSGALFSKFGLWTGITQNAYPGAGDDWNRYNTSNYSILFQLFGNTTYGEFIIYGAAPAGNPISNWSAIAKFRIGSEAGIELFGNVKVGSLQIGYYTITEVGTYMGTATTETLLDQYNNLVNELLRVGILAYKD